MPDKNHKDSKDSVEGRITMNIHSNIENEIVEDTFSVWCLKNHSDFDYSDGTGSERYLRNVFNKAKDLSSQSTELESYIKAWPSEYHLTTKRAQLLSGFTFNRSLRVLEVGCGCGAITRYLGENFDQVVSVEGNINRARLARQRCRDLDSVSVICAPFQEIKFSQKVDLIICIGVFEYSAAFIGGEDPYEATLKYFSDILSPNGMVVIAIENQFGLKYFSCAREDHLGTMFEGLEGYHRNPGKVRTFGKAELESRLKKHFPQIEFYYPYPDYKVPDCVISSEFLASGQAGELVSQIRSRDYVSPKRALWAESETNLELARNGMLEFFSNSFLVLAGRSELKGVAFEQLAILFSSGRKRAYSTKTRILRGDTGETLVEKRRVQEHGPADPGPLKLVGTNSIWVDALSLLTRVSLLARCRGRSLSEIFEPCKKWVEFLAKASRPKDGVCWLDGEHIDSIWSNTYLIKGECKLIDREWIWEGKIRMNVVVIRAIYDFLSRMETSSSIARSLSVRSGKSMIRDIATVIGVDLLPADFSEFIATEVEISWIVSGVSKARQSFYLRWFLADRPTRRFFRRASPIVRSLLSRVQARISNLV